MLADTRPEHFTSLQSKLRCPEHQTWAFSDTIAAYNVTRFSFRCDTALILLLNAANLTYTVWLICFK